jgi:mutator protein MutT
MDILMNYVSMIRKHIGHDLLLLVSAGVIIYKNRQILLQKRTDNGKWGIHGGCLELGETTEMTAKRELMEEIGIIPLSLKFYGVFSGEKMHYFYPNGDEVYLIAAVYFCDAYSGEFRSDENEVSELRWFSADQLPDDMNLPDAYILSGLNDYLKKNNII